MNITQHLKKHNKSEKNEMLQENLLKKLMQVLQLKILMNYKLY